jgi:uncharacterized protein YqjF (DUF2071 family)
VGWTSAVAAESITAPSTNNSLMNIDRVAPTRRPKGRPQGFQRWHRLLFSHWQVPEAVLRPLVPTRLALDDFEGRFYVGAVAFTMQNVRPFLWAPPIPTAREFGEVNLRTYVHIDGGEPGVFFFSLDASSSLAVLAARTLWGLPYFRADVTTDEAGAEITYRVRRRHASLKFEARAIVDALLEPPSPESLEFFLCERYQFYAEHRGQMRRARVHHAPYVLHAVREGEASVELLRAAKLPVDGARTPDLFSPGVDVEIFALENV